MYLRLLVVMILLAFSAGLTQTANAHAGVPSIAITAPADAVEDAGLSIAVSGEATAKSRLATYVSPAGQGDCAASPTAVYDARIDELEAGPFAVTVPYRAWAADEYVVCAWLSEVVAADPTAETPVGPVVATARQTFTVRAPRAELGLTVAPPDTPDSTSLRVVYQGSVEVDRSIYATVKPADGGACAASYGMDLGRSLTEGDMVSGGFGGRLEFHDGEAGTSYLVCVWLQESLRDAVALETAEVVVATPPQVNEDMCGAARVAVGRWARIVVSRKARYRAMHARRKAARTKEGKRRMSQRVKVVRESLERARVELEAAHDAVEEACS